MASILITSKLKLFKVGIRETADSPKNETEFKFNHIKRELKYSVILKMFTFRRNSGEFLFVFGMKDFLRYVKYKTIKGKEDKYFSALKALSAD